MLNSARFLKTHKLSTGKLGVTGFCWGGSTTNFLAAALGADMQAGVPYYGAAAETASVPKIKAPLLIHYAESDERINEMWPAYETALKAAGVSYQAHIYPGTQHGFHNNSTPRYKEAAAKLSWERTIALLQEKSGLRNRSRGDGRRKAGDRRVTASLRVRCVRCARSSGQNPKRAPSPNSVATPSKAKIAAAIPCTSFIGIFAASRSPMNTAGTSAISMPSVVPMTTVTGDAKCAAMATVAICVLSPISARKNVTSVAPKTPKRPAARVSSSSILSGISVQIAMPMNRESQYPAQDRGTDRRSQPRAERTGQAMIDDRRREDARDDRQRLLEARGQDKGEKLGLVADFGERDDAG